MSHQYKIFKRSWWKHNPSWPNKREPYIGKKTHIKYVDTEEEARRFCEEYNRLNKPGPSGIKAEFEKA